MKLSVRLQAVADMITTGNRVADVGTDHGYIPIYMTVNNLAPYAYAMDVNKGPLNRAQSNIELYELGDKVETRLSDGLKALKAGEAESVVIAGMGGLLTIRLLQDSSELLSDIQELILSPHSDVKLVREYVIDNGFVIADENMVIDEGKFYTIMRLTHGNASKPDELGLMFGQKLLDSRNPILYKYLCKEQDKNLAILDKLNANSFEGNKRVKEIEHKLDCIKKGLEYYEK